ncbi:MAG: hypothetical protein ABL994_19260, partial [Verrucomicrobiales bacterium]
MADAAINLPPFQDEVRELIVEVPEHELVVREAANLHDLLGRPDLLERYLGLMAKYLRATEVHRPAFRTLVQQLKAATESIPGLADRLWETDQLGKPFLISMGMQSYGRIVNQEAWALYSAHFRETLAKTAEPFLSLPIQKRENEIQLQIKLLLEEVELTKQVAAESSNRKTATLIYSNFFQKLRHNRRLTALISYLLLSASKDRELSERLYGDADLILNTLAMLKSTPGTFIPILRSHPLLASMARGLLPAVSDLLADKNLFVPATRMTRNGKMVEIGSAPSLTYLFRPLTRRFHGIWKGLTVGDCVGGDPRWGADNATPERWATVALAGTQVHYIEQILGETPTLAEAIPPTRRLFTGFVQAVPLKLERTGELYASVEFMSPVISRRALFTDSSGVGQLTSSFELWLQASAKLRPPAWKGYVIGRS